MTTPPKKTSTRTYGGLSESERVLERRERFLEAGLEVFGTVGLRGATVRVLCKAAGLTERYFYESFADTETLFCAVYDKQRMGLHEFFMKELPNLPKDIEARIHAALNLYFTAMRNERLVRILNLECMSGSERVSAMHHANTRLYAEMAAQLIRFDNPQLDIPHEMATSVAMAINGACATLGVQWMLGGYGTQQETMVKSAALVVMGTMHELHRLSGKTP